MSLFKTTEIRRSDYSVVGGFVCYDRGVRDELIRIVNILRVDLEKGGKPICVLLCGDAGIGKTFFVKQVAAACKAKYVHKNLSLTTNLKDDLDQHILEIALAHSKVVAFLDEVHTIVGGETAYRFVQQPMSGDEYIISRNPVRLTDLIWFFATSRATSPSEFQEVLRAESNQNGVDFVDRCRQPFQIVLPGTTDPRERIVKVVAMAKAQRHDLENIEASVLFYYASTEFQSARDMESHVRVAVNSLPSGATILELQHVVKGKESLKFHRRYDSELQRLTGLLIRIS